MKSFRISILVVAAALMIMGIAGTTYAFHDGGVATCESCHTMHNSLNGSIVMLSKYGSNYASNPTEFNNATQFLLHGSDQSSTCLNCHASNDAAGAESSYHIMSEAPGGIPSERTPGGDFAWLTVSGTGTVNPANHHGHNIVAADFGLTSSTNYAANGNVSPGGSYPIAKLYCSSCHNPHSDYRYDSGGNLVQRTIGANVGPIIGSGSYGNSGALPPAGETIGVYRFLGGAGYIPKSISASNPSAAFT
ncbi:MAG TPA: hypothetical protein VLX29_04185, partial [Nitrospirota bacterium]|nr:hypothetical protein [Nitrospirota bacterium]